MRGSAPEAVEYRTDLTALPLIGSIRWLSFLKRQPKIKAPQAERLKVLGSGIGMIVWVPT